MLDFTNLTILLNLITFLQILIFQTGTLKLITIFSKKKYIYINSTQIYHNKIIRVTKNTRELKKNN